MKFLEVHTSFSRISDAKRVARMLVEERLAACANVLPAYSIYKWKGKIEETDEVLVFFKTDEVCYSALEKRLSELHPYEVPMIVAHKLHEGAESYLAWIENCLEEK